MVAKWKPRPESIRIRPSSRWVTPLRPWSTQSPCHLLAYLWSMVAARAWTPKVPSRRFRHGAFKIDAARLLSRTLYFFICRKDQTYPSLVWTRRPEQILVYLLSRVAGLSPGHYSFCTRRETLLGAAITQQHDGKNIYVTGLFQTISSFACNFDGNSPRHGRSQVPRTHVYYGAPKEAVHIVHVYQVLAIGRDIQ